MTSRTDYAVAVRGLRKRRGSFLLHDVDLSLPTGFVTGLVGPNGSGKTTLIRTLLGLIRPDAGEIAVLGTPGARRAREGVGVVLDQITATPEWRAGSVGGRIRRIFPRWDEQRFQSLLDRFDVPRTTRIGDLSRGQTVKLSLAMALGHDPELLILDEPSSGLDPVARRDLADVIREFMLDPSHTVLFSTHITTDLDDLADHLVVMAAGTIACAGELTAIREQFAVIRTHEPLPAPARAAAIGLRTEAGGVTRALIRVADSALFGPAVAMDPATTDDIVVHHAEQAATARTDRARMASTDERSAA